MKPHTVYTDTHRQALLSFVFQTVTGKYMKADIHAHADTPDLNNARSVSGTQTHTRLQTKGCGYCQWRGLVSVPQSSTQLPLLYGEQTFLRGNPAVSAQSNNAAGSVWWRCLHNPQNAFVGFVFTANFVVMCAPNIAVLFTASLMPLQHI